MLTFLFEAMESSLLEAFATSHSGLRLAGQRLTDLCDAHAEIFHQVAARDEKAATLAMSAILNNAEANLRAAIGNG